MLITIQSKNKTRLDVVIDPDDTINKLRDTIVSLYNIKYFDIYNGTLLNGNNQSIKEAGIKEGDIIDVVPILTPESKKLEKDSKRALSTFDSEDTQLNILFTENPNWKNEIPLHFYYSK